MSGFKEFFQSKRETLQKTFGVEITGMTPELLRCQILPDEALKQYSFPCKFNRANYLVNISNPCLKPMAYPQIYINVPEDTQIQMINSAHLFSSFLDLVGVMMREWWPDNVSTIKGNNYRVDGHTTSSVEGCIHPLMKAVGSTHDQNIDKNLTQLQIAKIITRLKESKVAIGLQTGKYINLNQDQLVQLNQYVSNDTGLAIKNVGVHR